MTGFLFSLAVSALLTWVLVRSAGLHARRTGDRDFSKPQKLHVQPVPRIGGLAVFIGLCAGLIWWWRQDLGGAVPGLLLLCSAPAFLAGFVQDCTEAVTPRGRLVATAVSAVLAFVLLDAALRDTAIPGLDQLVQFALGSLALTVFAVSGVANSINIIDGLNGLASMCVMLMLGAVAYVAFQVGDSLVGDLALAAIGAIFGFFLWNFPAGLIFLGDGGAYFLGFYFSELSILLINRNAGEVSPLFPLLVCIYPVYETLFSIYRRRILRSTHPYLPDGIHLHSLIYRRVIRWSTGTPNARHLARRNSMSSLYLWLLCMASVLPAMWFWSNTLMLALFIFLFGLGYMTLYRRIVRFKAPRWMFHRHVRSRAEGPGDNRRT